ncbi:hypothetical protein KCU67_g5285, partial [Aureobasidium melanogenum]
MPDTGPTMGFETSMYDEDMSADDKILLCSGLVLAFLGILACFIELPVWTKLLLPVLFVYWSLVALYTPFRLWTFEKLGLMGKPMDPEPQIFDELRMILGLESKGKLDENTSDWEDIENTSNSSETFGIDTPSETGKSDSRSIPVSTDSVLVDWTEYSRATARDAIDTASFSDGAASSLDTSVQPLARQDTSDSQTQSQRHPASARRGQAANSTDTSATIVQQPEPPKSPLENPIETLAMKLKQPRKSNPSKDSHKPRSKIASGHQSIPTSYMFEKAKQQPADVIVLYIIKGIEYEERMLVRMYKTTPFVLLKNELRDKDDTVSELAIKNPEGGEFPVFDNDTPLSLERSKPESLNQTRKQTLQQPLQEHTLETCNTPSSKKARSNHKQVPKPTSSSSSKQRAEHQPAKIIIVEVRKGIAFKEKLIVRMYRTSSFSSLKAALNSDKLGDDTHGLAIKDDEGGYYPVFDNDTPISVGLQHWATLFWVPTPQVPKSLDLTEDIEMDYGHSRRKPSGNARRY